MSLPLVWVDRIFGKLMLTYGAAWTQKWRDVDPLALKEDWARELDGFDQHPEAIRHALENLPASPPNVLEFRAIARRAPMPKIPRLEAPTASRERVAAEIAKLAPARAAQRCDQRDWARRIVAKKKSGESVSFATYRIACCVLNTVPTRDA
jgi:hypothetical protein